MASLRSHNSLAYGSRSNSAVPPPSGIQDGDQIGIVFIIAANGGAPAFTPPEGLDEIVDSPYPQTLTRDGFELEVHLYEKTADGEAGDYTFTHASASTAAFIFAVEDGAPGFQVTGAQENDVTPTAPTITPAGDNALIVFHAVSFNFLGAVTPPGAPPEFTERLDSGANLIYAATGEMATAEATGGKTITVTDFPSAAGLIVVEAAEEEPPAGSGGVGSRFDDWL